MDMSDETMMRELDQRFASLEQRMDANLAHQDQRWDDLEKRQDERWADLVRSTKATAEALEFRLEGLNQWREQSRVEAASFLRQDVFKERTAGQERALTLLADRVAETDRKVSDRISTLDATLTLKEVELEKKVSVSLTDLERKHAARIATIEGRILGTTLGITAFFSALTIAIGVMSFLIK